MSNTSEMPLPKSFVSVGDICSWDEDRLRAFPMVNVIGMVIDAQDAVQTRGADWKASMTFYDISTQDDYETSLKLNIFRPQSNMPSFKCGDTVLVFQAKAQSYRGSPVSLITNWNTSIHVFQTGPEQKLQRKDFRGKSGRDLTPLELQYVEHLNQVIDRARVPDAEVFEKRKIESVAIKGKFRELKDVKDGSFCDVIVELAKKPFDFGDSFTLWVTDYTENPGFYAINPSRGMVDNQDGDPMGYTNNFNKKPAEVEHAELSGKRTMQITTWEPHSSVIRDCRLKQGDWVGLRNVHIKFGRNNANLEGFLREDRAHPGRKGVYLLDNPEDPREVDPRFKEAVRRKRDYEKAQKKALGSILDAQTAGQKRKAALQENAEPRKFNSKGRCRNRRDQKRTAAKAAGSDGNLAYVRNTDVSLGILIPALTAAKDTNTQVKCESKDKPLSPVNDLLELPMVMQTVGGRTTEIVLPFKEVSYRVNTRVVDFWPHRLHRFAIPTPKPKTKEVFDILSDNEESDDGISDTEMVWEDENAKEWEWRFWLQLEDAVQGMAGDKQRAWVVVNNSDAEYLTSLQACDLRQNHARLEALREKLGQLWGNLEERKLLTIKAQDKPTKGCSSGQPPPDSSDGEHEGQAGAGPNLTARLPLQNLAFNGCVREYGKKIPEENAFEADAGEGKRWQRIHALFGTKICG